MKKSEDKFAELCGYSSWEELEREWAADRKRNHAYREKMMEESFQKMLDILTDEEYRAIIGFDRKTGKRVE
jgi:hypothetical protein